MNISNGQPYQIRQNKFLYLKHFCRNFYTFSSFLVKTTDSFDVFIQFRYTLLDEDKTSHKVKDEITFQKGYLTHLCQINF